MHGHASFTIVPHHSYWRVKQTLITWQVVGYYVIDADIGALDISEDDTCHTRRWEKGKNISTSTGASKIEKGEQKYTLLASWAELIREFSCEEKVETLMLQLGPAKTETGVQNT